MVEAEYDISTSLISGRYSANAGPPVLPMSEAQIEARDRLMARIASGRYEERWSPCGICAGTSFVVIAERDRYNVAVKTCICKGCGLVQTNPRLRSEDYEDLYKTLYRSLYTSSEVPLDEFFKKQKRIGRRILDYVAGRVEVGPGTRILEIGAGAGGTLEVLCAGGAVGLGLDLDETYLNHGRNRWLNLQFGAIGSFDLAFRPDFVVYRHVLEHMVDPIGELKAVRVKGRRGYTHLYVEVPGIDSVEDGPTRLRGDFLRTLQSVHINYFSKASLTNVFHLSGYKVLKIDDSIRSLALVSGKEKQGLQVTEDWRVVLERLRCLDNRLVGAGEAML
ncbi:methyltransferase domain-containing protein [uncultured Roseibium sp.]|uniref:class I SAM-dependent methyltransferase n=1 Tax=uncultured Roseibium sp. TaxID=1936171 RepID=UPI002636C470|nr:methyltransferase domain-containing protein [uncultured Roseibium sp.]